MHTDKSSGTITMSLYKKSRVTKCIVEYAQMNEKSKLRWVWVETSNTKNVTIFYHASRKFVSVNRNLSSMRDESFLPVDIDYYSIIHSSIWSI